MDKYTLLKRFHRDHQLQSYMYISMHVDPDTMPVEDTFPATKTIVENYGKFSTPVPVSKYLLGFSFIC